GMPGAIASTTWYVKAPSGTVWPFGQRARLLIVDDVPSTSAGNVAADALYQNAARAHLPDSTFGIATISSRGPFRSVTDVEPTLTIPDSTAAWGNVNGGVLRSSLLGDSLRFSGGMPVVSNGLPGLRALDVHDTSEVLLWAQDNALEVGVHDQYPVALSVTQPG